MELGLNWAKQSRLKRIDGKEPDYMGEDKEFLILYTKEYLKAIRILITLSTDTATSNWI